MGSSSSSTSSAVSEVTPYRDMNLVLDYLEKQNTIRTYVNWDETLVNIMFAKTVLVSVSSIICVLLNFALLYFLTDHKNFRNLFFAPLAVQAFIDALGPGLANAIYEVYSYKKFKAEAHQNMEYGVPVIETMTTNEQKIYIFF